MIFKRKIYEKLKEWKEESQGKTALLIEGARRVGKSTLVEDFAKREYESYILIDFSFAGENVLRLFDDLSDLKFFFLQLQLLFHVDLYERNSAIIFDEVQLCPKARQAIKVLVKDGRYDYIETGSLISIKKNVQNILIPSEERKIEMHPMDYEEFRWALGDMQTPTLLKQLYSSKKPVGQDVHRKLMRDFRLYMLVGGMPQAVKEYIETNNFRKVDMVKRDILALYEDDFRKIDTTGRLSDLFDAIPSQLERHKDRYSSQSVLDARISETSLLSMISELQDSKTVSVAYHVDEPSVGLAAHKNLSQFRLYLLDTGLFVTLMFKDRDFTENVIYEKLLNDKLSSNLGFLYENAVAQTLRAKGYKLYYHTFYNEIAHRSYKVDFLFSKKNKICPIEVKSSNYRTYHSLDAFQKKYSSQIMNRYIIHTKDFKKEEDILCYPIYLLENVLDEA